VTHEFDDVRVLLLDADGNLVEEREVRRKALADAGVGFVIEPWDELTAIMLDGPKDGV
jgi:hypothetical protein